MTDTTSEFAAKRERIADLMAQHQLQGLLLTRSASWSWATCGREANIATNSESAVAALLFTPQRDYLLANRIEMPRMVGEELSDNAGGLVLPFEPVEFGWHEPQQMDALVQKLAGAAVGSDQTGGAFTSMAGEIAALRFALLPAEQERFRALGKITGEAVEAAARTLQPGMSEHEIAGSLAGETFKRGAFPVVTLVATDERIHRFRHPSATAKRLERYAMVIVCARQHGLIASATRLVHFGQLSSDLERRMEACALVDQAVHEATRPGKTIGQVFGELQAAYAAQGFDGEWRDHHQGGLAGYENREQLGLPGNSTPVQAGQAYAWNPSIAGVKFEDTILVGEASHDVITATGAWPLIKQRPAVLVR